MQISSSTDLALKTLAVFTGAGVGGVLRYLAQVLVVAGGGKVWAATLVVNSAGAFLMGLLAGMLLLRSQLPPVWSLLLGTGFLGGFTTLSTFSLESLQLLQEQQWRAFFLYWGISSLGCIMLCLLGLVSVKALFT